VGVGVGGLWRCPFPTTITGMSLFEKYLPRHQFAERHHIAIKASPSAVLDAVAGGNLPSDPIITGLMGARAAPGRILKRLGLSSAAQPEGFGLPSFIPLERDGDREIASGLIGRFWRPDGGLAPITDAAGFLAFDSGRTAKLVIVWTARPEGDHTRLITETRIWCPDDYSRAMMTAYWLVIRLPSGLIRRRLLSAIKRSLEAG
jgi:hypothetical protein